MFTFPKNKNSVALLLSSVMATTVSFTANGNELSVSPPNWWVGMASPTLELMIHGEGVADDTVRLVTKNGLESSVNPGEKSGVKIEKIQALDSNNYLFVTLNTEDARSGEIVLLLEDKDGTKRNLHYTLQSRSEKSSQRQGFTAKDAIYLIAPDRFANGNIENDNVDGYADSVDRENKGGRHGGDIEGIIDHLDYISDMGFTQIWTMPLLENAMDAYSYHGYSTTDYYKIDPRFGSNEDYVSLSNHAAEKGVGIIMDMVLNHIGSNHLWMKDKPSADWINNKGTFKGTTHKRESLHDPHAVASDVKGFSDGWFVPTMPDLNQRNPHLANYLIQNAIWWVEYANLSGIRVDTYSYSDKDFLAQWTQSLMAEYPNFNIVGEEWSVNPAITAYWQAGSHRHDDYESALPSVMDFPLQTAVVEALTSDESWNSGFISIYETLATDFLYGDPNNLVVFPDNHDMSRIFTQVDHDVRKWNMAMTLFLTTRGIPQVFYGTEILMSNPDTDDHGIIRTDFPGGWAQDNQKNGFNDVGLSEDEKWAKQRVRTLLNLRRNHASFFEGELKHYAPKEGVYTYFRIPASPSDGLLMTVLSKKEQSVALSEYAEMLSGFKTLTKVSTGEVFSTDDKVSIEAMSAQVFIVR